jgi:exonuclease III
MIYFVYNHIFVLHQNIHGLINKSDMLTVCLEELRDSNKSIDILCITEHNMTSGDVTNLNIPNYRLASYFCRDNRHGGSCILIGYKLNFITLKHINKLSVSNVIELCAVEIVQHNITVVCVYRPPKYDTLSFEIFFNKLHVVLSSLCTKKKKVIICGDLNINTLESSKRANDFINILSCYNIRLHFKEPTRSASGTCLDNIAHNFGRCMGVVTELGLSDHFAQILQCPVKKTSTLNYWFIMRRDYSLENRNKFIDSLRKLSFAEITSIIVRPLSYYRFDSIFFLVV